MNDDDYIFQEVFFALKEQNYKLVTAESITAGMIVSDFAKVSGASAVLWGGIISYDTEVKLKLLNVSKETIKQYGVISNQVAIEMAHGALEIFNKNNSGASSCIALGITGVAGPAKQENKPIGTVHIAILDQKKNDKTKSSTATFIKFKELSLLGTRAEIRKQCVNEAMKFILECIK